MKIYHNYVRALEVLHGETLSEVAGIKVQSENGLTVIQNAATNRNVTINEIRTTTVNTHMTLIRPPTPRSIIKQ